MFQEWRSCIPDHTLLWELECDRLEMTHHARLDLINHSTWRDRQRSVLLLERQLMAVRFSWNVSAVPTLSYRHLAQSFRTRAIPTLILKVHTQTSPTKTYWNRALGRKKLQINKHNQAITLNKQNKGRQNTTQNIPVLKIQTHHSHFLSQRGSRHGSARKTLEVTLNLTQQYFLLYKHSALLIEHLWIQKSLLLSFSHLNQCFQATPKTALRQEIKRERR